MKKQIVQVTHGVSGNVVMVDILMLTHKGLGMHSEIKGHYSFTHIKSGYGSLVNRKMTHKQARQLVELMADKLDWTQDLKDITPTHEKQKEVLEMWNSAYTQVRYGL